MKYITLLFVALFVTACTTVPPAQVDKAVDDLMKNVDNMEGQMEDMMDDIEGDVEDENMDEIGEGESSSEAMDDMDDTEAADDMADKDDMEDSNNMDDEEAMGDTEVIDDTQAATGNAVYATYSDDVLANGETKVIFFHADWCPNCRTNDANLTTWFGAENTYSRSIYKVDYDASTELKVALGVTSQDTFVVVNGAGEVVDGPHTFPSEEKLIELLS